MFAFLGVLKTLFVSRDLFYLAIIGILLVSVFVMKTHYVGKISEATQATATCQIEKANLSNELGLVTRKQEIYENNYKQCKAGIEGLNEWIESYTSGAAKEKTSLSEQLSACIKAKPAVPVNTKEGVKGVSYEEGKAMDNRIRNRLLGGAK